MPTVTVTTLNEFTTALSRNNVEIELAADIILTTNIGIRGLTGVVINGNNFKVDGNNAVQCFLIANGAEVSFNDLAITNCYGNVRTRSVETGGKIGVLLVAQHH